MYVAHATDNILHALSKVTAPVAKADSCPDWQPQLQPFCCQAAAATATATATAWLSA